PARWKNMPAWSVRRMKARSRIRAPENGLWNTTRTHDMKLGFCGLGLMGAAMVRRLLEAGHEVKVWNRSAGKAAALVAHGAQVAASPREAAEGVDGLLLCLFDAKAVEAVVFGPEGAAQASGLKWLADHSSIDPQATRDMAVRLAQANGADWIDAPVSGGVPGVEAG